MITSNKKNVCIIGYGRLGSHLYYALKDTGKYKINALIKNSSSPLNVQDVNNSNIIFICTQDSKIKTVVNKLAGEKFNLRTKTIYHTSGAHSSDILLNLKKKGAYIGSFHPVQTFEQITKKDLRRFKDIYIAIEGDKRAIKEASTIILKLNAHQVVLSKRRRVLHHINCVIASNFLIGLLSEIQKISTSLGFEKNNKKIPKNGFNKPGFFDIYKPLITQTMKNIERMGLENSLTGPIERNDLDTVMLHLNTLNSECKELLPFYILMSFETAKLGVKKKSLSQEDVRALHDLMKNYLINNKLLN
jgi:predicted short-subunit dehydrogenase-like oxidoreductase (DUF2520 family)